VHQNIHQAQISGDLRRRHQTRKNKPSGQAGHCGGHGLKARTPGTITQQQESHIRDSSHHLNGGGKQLIVSLELEETSHLAHDKLTGADPQSLGQL
jgi:hypothetical protein